MGVPRFGPAAGALYMVWLILIGVLVIIGGLAGLFTVHARLIKRDVEERFGKIQASLEEEANTVVDDLLNEHRRRTLNRPREGDENAS